MDQRARGGHEDAFSADRFDCLQDERIDRCEICEPNVSAVDAAEAESLVGSEGVENVRDLFGGTNDADVQASGVEVESEGEIVAEASEVGGEHEIDGNFRELPVGASKGLLFPWCEVGDKTRFIDLNVGDTFGLQGLENLLVHCDQFWKKQRDVKV